MRGRPRGSPVLMTTERIGSSDVATAPEEPRASIKGGDSVPACPRTTSGGLLGVQSPLTMEILRVRCVACVQRTGPTFSAGRSGVNVSPRTDLSRLVGGGNRPPRGGNEHGRKQGSHERNARLHPGRREAWQGCLGRRRRALRGAGILPQGVRVWVR